ncbi:hypothetical protein IGB42_02992 [Andreprevotia sp. IGB-42]|uniref:hypothetical protein n=1 Tax=Andreprevotia sp. IGB-42 TaxID=2497473 RepID=UPI001358973D|nr:hypothetical protein [Andreprevotia sp. IGB-42]KAF0812700.1 hypothetical protein IGB42_02992 [Andreprevotia sp. IGB-42]
MKKLFALGVVLFSVMQSASAQTYAFSLANNAQDPNGQDYCLRHVPGSQFRGFQPGNSDYHYILCVL